MDYYGDTLGLANLFIYLIKGGLALVRMLIMGIGQR